MEINRWGSCWLIDENSPTLAQELVTSDQISDNSAGINPEVSTVRKNATQYSNPRPVEHGFTGSKAHDAGEVTFHNFTNSSSQSQGNKTYYKGRDKHHRPKSRPRFE